MIAVTSDQQRRDQADRRLRQTGVVLIAALLVHSIDHVVRGLDVVTWLVTTAGTIQFIVAAVAVWLVFAGHRQAPPLAMLIGFAGAVGFSSAHLLPQWSLISDPYVGAQMAPGVTWFSWLSALFEIAADLAFGLAGVRAWQANATPATAPLGLG